MYNNMPAEIQVALLGAVVAGAMGILGAIVGGCVQSLISYRLEKKRSELAEEKRRREFLQQEADRWERAALEWAGQGRRDSLRGAVLVDLDLRGVDLTGADLSYCRLQSSELRRAKLSQACLIGADMESADLQQAELQGADLEGASLSATDLRRADLRDAHVADAEFCDADLRGADLSGAHWEGYPPRFSGAQYDDETSWPAGHVPAGAIKTGRARRRSKAQTSADRQRVADA